MKRLSCFAVLLVFCFSIFAISVNPSMDGRAVVADSGVFPPGGYYGRAPGYLPGDTVVVTNHNNGFSIDVLILGTYDAYEGIAILLSPEAADKLQIVKGKDVYVKVQKKQPISYEEAVATSRNKKIEEKQALDTDKDSSVLPGQTEQLVNDVIASKTNSEIFEDEILPLEDLETLETEVEISEPVFTEVAEVENFETEIESDEIISTEELSQVEEELYIPEEEVEVVEIPQEEIEDQASEVAEVEITEPVLTEVAEVENFETEIESDEIISTEELAQVEEETFILEEEVEVAEIPQEEIIEEEIELAELEELAEPEEFIESEAIDSPVFEVVEEIPEVEEEPVMEVAEELPVEDLEEVVLDDIQNEDFDETDFIDTPVESEIAEVPEEVLPEEEILVEEVTEEIAELEDSIEEDFDDEEYIVLDDIPEAEEELAYVDESPVEELPTEEEMVELEPVEEIVEVPEFEEETEVALEELSPADELEEVLIPEEEIIVPEVLATETVEDEPELALLDDYIDEPVKSVAENPKDIFSMIVGEELEDDVIEEVVLEEAEPKLPELDDSYSEENDVADLEITLDEPEANLSEIVVEQEPVAVVKEDVSTKAVVSSDIDGYANTVSDFKDLPKVENAKSSTYYIQIATVNKKENVAKMIELHGKKYPVYVIKNPAKSSYQILVGPLNDDEYALVLARFKQTYKDAFLRVAK